MKQVCIIHGGSTFESEEAYLKNLETLELHYTRMLYGRDWKQWLGETLTNYEVVLPKMPNSAFAKYDEWALIFSKVILFLKPDAILIGHSLGGIFLAKYLNEHPELHFHKVALVAAPFDAATKESLASFTLPADMKNLQNAADQFALFQGKDDEMVPYEEAYKYAAVLPSSQLILLEDRGHFNQETLPELLTFIQK